MAKKRPPLIFFGNSSNAIVFDEIAKAATANVDIIQTCVNLPWAASGPGMMEMALKANPKALFIPRLFLHPPQSWMTTHPDQMVRNETGSLMPANNWPSLGSDLFFNEVKNQMSIFIRYMQNSPLKDRIIGYMPCYMAEGCWFYYDIYNLDNHYFDYSEVNRQKFITWLQVRYANNIQTLNTAWNRSYSNFAAVQIPPVSEWEAGDDGIFRSPAIHRAVADYLTYHNEIVADRIIELCDLIKTLTSNKGLTPVFYGYHNETVINGYTHGNAHSGLLATRRVLAAPSVDILAAPISYHDRGVGAPMNMMSVVDSAPLAGKLYLQEDDSRTSLWTPPPTPGTLDYNLWYPTPWDDVQCLTRNFGDIIGHNQATWWMDLSSNGNFNSDSIWQNNGKMTQAYDNCIQSAQTVQPQVALLYDENTFFWLKTNCYGQTGPNIASQRTLFQSLGAQVGYYYVQDIDKIPASVKLFVFVNPYYMSDSTKALVETAKKNNRTLMWYYAPGYVSDTALSKTRMEQLTGFTFGKQDTSIIPEIRIENSVHPICDSLGGQLFGNSASSSFSPTFYCTSPTSEATVLGRYTATNQPGLVAREFANWKSVYCGAAIASAPLLRSICRYAGIDLLDDADSLATADAVNYNGRYLYVYAMNQAGRRCFQLPGEKIPNGGFEKFTGPLPTQGLGHWISPFSGSIPATVVSSSPHSGSNACQTGPFTNAAGQNSTPVGIRLQAEDGKTYKISAWCRVDGLTTSSATSGDFIALNVQAHDWNSDGRSYKIANGTKANLRDKQWTQITGAYTHHATIASYPRELSVRLSIRGAYSATNLQIDDVSVREDGCEPVRVREVQSGKIVSDSTTGWVSNFQLNEAKIFELTPIGNWTGTDWPNYR